METELQYPKPWPGRCWLEAVMKSWREVAWSWGEEAAGWLQGSPAGGGCRRQGQRLWVSLVGWSQP